ncbi:hypothetical protein SteCoe_10465 [Stentor coeruleus]|uniref:Trichohyalin-plectin-homology domain-containing protein n=1 Tax=Stentor coeruleus TaxID=5963 RepID=A0A1R2CFE6_9CILI|nr:hypothetical protein SteCoe_10465 [Stentor coeruleus]
MANDIGKNVAVISLAELDRIRRTCSGMTPNEEDQQRRKEDRATLHDKSRNRMKDWGNSVEALREKKEYERYKKFEAEELERRRIDAEEEALQEEKKRQAIEKANKILHDSSDQVKAFHSKMFLADVLQEREMQLEINKKKEAFQKDLEQQWLHNEKQQLQEYDKQMIIKLQQEQKRKQEVKKTLKDQLTDNKQRIVKRMQEDYIEGQLMKKKAKEDIEAEKKAEMARRQRAIEAQSETKKANEYLQELKRQEAQRLAEEEKRTMEYAAKKEAVMSMRKGREEKKFKEKLESRQRMIDARIEELSNLKSNEEQRLNDQVMEAEIKAKEQYDKKMQRLEDLRNQIEKSRKQQIERRQQEKTTSKQEEEMFAEFWKDKMKELTELEKLEEQEKRERGKQLQNFHKKQMDYKARKAEQEALIEEELARQAIKMQEDEQLQFHSYAEKCLKEWSEQGKNIAPLILELKNYKKRIV